MAYGAVLNQRNYWTPIIQITGDYSTPDYTFTLTKDGTTTTTTGTANETLLYPWEFGEYTVSISNSGQSVVQSFTVEINSVKLYQFSFPQTTPSTGASGSNFQEFTSDGTFIVPSGVTTIYVTACGGGGGGGATANNLAYVGPAGSGAACIYKKPFSVIPNSSIEITLGIGGNGASSYNTPGSNGTSTVIGNLITLPGGSGGYDSYGPNPVVKQSGGGIGGGGFRFDSSEGDYSFPADYGCGQDGLIGKGGKSTISFNINLNQTAYIPEGTWLNDNGYGSSGGGGSLGDGGSCYIISSSNKIENSPGYGGGGHSRWSNRILAQKGGDGYVLIEW